MEYPGAAESEGWTRCATCFHGAYMYAIVKMAGYGSETVNLTSQRP